MARVRLTAGAREAVTVVVGLSATASGRVSFEGDSSPPPAGAGSRIPMFASAGQTCHYGSPTVASDWSFTIDGLAGTCRSVPTAPLTARWVLKSVILDGREVLDDNVWLEPGRHYENVRIVMTDRRSQVRVRVTEADGTPTGDTLRLRSPSSASDGAIRIATSGRRRRCPPAFSERQIRAELAANRGDRCASSGSRRVTTISSPWTTSSTMRRVIRPFWRSSRAMRREWQSRSET